MSQINGTRLTTNVSSDNRKPDIDNKLVRLDPESTPLIVIMKQMPKKETSQTEFSYFDKALMSDLIKVNNGGGYNSSATSIVVDDSTNVKVGDIVVSATTLERLYVSAVDYSTHTLTVTRSIGSVAAGVLADDEELLILGSAHQEGGDAANAISFEPTKRTNCIQIFKTALKMSMTQKQTDQYTGDDYSEQKRDAALLHKLELERAAWFNDGGASYYYTGSDGRARVTNGILNQITSNVLDAGGTLTEAELDNFLETVGNKGNSEKTLFASARLISIMNGWGKDRWQPSSLSEKYGLPGVKEYLNPHCKLNVVNARQIFRGPFQYWNAILDLPLLKYRPLKGRDTAFEKVTTTKDVVYEQFITECGFEIRNEAAHAIIKNATTQG